MWKKWREIFEAHAPFSSNASRRHLLNHWDMAWQDSFILKLLLLLNKFVPLCFLLQIRHTCCWRTAYSTLCIYASCFPCWILWRACCLVVPCMCLYVYIYIYFMGVGAFMGNYWRVCVLVLRPRLLCLPCFWFPAGIKPL